MSAGSVASLVPISEAELQTAIIDCAVALGWLVYHTHDSRHSPEGFPDLILVREPRLIIAELKGVDRRGRPGVVKVAQAEWLLRLDTIAGVVEHLVEQAGAADALPGVAEAPILAVRLWRPVDWTSGQVERELRARAEPA